MDVAKVLEDAADVLLVNGRCTFFGRTMTGGEFCTLGAIAEAVEPGWYKANPSSYWSVIERNPVASEAVRRVVELIPPGGIFLSPALAVGEWNDEPTTTDDEVRDTLLLAAKDARNEAAA